MPLQTLILPAPFSPVQGMMELIETMSWNNSKEQLSQPYRGVKTALFLETLGARWALSKRPRAGQHKENLSHAQVPPLLLPCQGGGPGGGVS